MGPKEINNGATGKLAFMLQGRRNPENGEQCKQTCLLISWVVNERTLHHRDGTAEGGCLIPQPGL